MYVSDTIIEVFQRGTKAEDTGQGSVLGRPHRVLLNHKLIPLLGNKYEGNSLAVWWLCCREEQILTPRWNCFFDLLFIAVVIKGNSLPQRTLPFCLSV